MEDVAAWLERRHLAHFIPYFLRARIDGHALLSLHSLSDLARIGIDCDVRGRVHLLEETHSLLLPPLHPSAPLLPGFTILLTLLTERQRHLVAPHSHALYLALLSRMAPHLPDEVFLSLSVYLPLDVVNLRLCVLLVQVVLSRLVPYLVAMIRIDPEAVANDPDSSAVHKHSYIVCTAITRSFILLLLFLFLLIACLSSSAIGADGDP